MSKEIVAMSEIAKDPCLEIIQLFRIANKRCGETRRQFNSATDENERRQAEAEYKVWRYQKLPAFKAQAREHDFEIWVNPNGKTGHTYSKDYKLTDDADNDIERFHLNLAGRRTTIQQRIDAAIEEETGEVEPPEIESAEIETIEESTSLEEEEDEGEK
jgi:hypothetical protein